MSDVKYWSMVMQQDYDALADELAAVKARLREQAQEAYEDVEDWSGYASEYFREKHNLAGDLKKWKDRAADSADEVPT